MSIGDVVNCACDIFTTIQRKYQMQIGLRTEGELLSVDRLIEVLRNAHVLIPRGTQSVPRKVIVANRKSGFMSAESGNINKGLGLRVGS